MAQNSRPRAGAFAPYADVPIGFEKMYTGQTDQSVLDSSNPYLTYSADTDGNVMMQYSV